MFVMNCDVDDTERLKFPKQDSDKKGKKRKKGKAANQNTADSSMDNTSPSSVAPEGDTDPPGGDTDMYNPVRCTECNTEVGVYDSDEIYHFFNVLASYS